MEALRQYLLSVTSAALLCGILNALIGKKGTIAAVSKLLCGIFLTVTLIKPLLNISVDNLMGTWDGYSLQAQAAVNKGEEISSDAVCQIIKQQAEAYILDKADSLGVSVTVEIKLSDDPLPVPESVTIYGNVAPYQRRQLCEILEKDLDISGEHQLWIT